MTDPDQIATLLIKKLEGELSPTEKLILDEWVHSTPSGSRVMQDLLVEENIAAKLKDHHPDNWQATNTRIKAAVSASLFDSEPVAPIHRIHFLRTAWFYYAAAVLLVCGVGAYLWKAQTTSKKELAQQASLEFDKMPGTDKATLTLANGQAIAVDSLPNGELAVENGSGIVKQDGRIIYNEGVGATSKVAYNTMSTSRGGQYQITLADGTRAWLNAESSITFPTSFTGSTREVSIKGEVYFEVAKDAAKPFMVNVNGRSQIQVLGTEFNVNAYDNEDNIHATLLNGSIKVWPGASQSKLVNAAILKPGEEAQIAAQNAVMNVVFNPDLEKVIAWKNGVFNFEDVPLEKAMRQLARWYDIQIVYEKGGRPVQFGGSLKRNLPLSGILYFLEGAGLRYRLEDGNKLVVLK